MSRFRQQSKMHQKRQIVKNLEVSKWVGGIRDPELMQFEHIRGKAD
jgi:hypothetical protein